MKKFLYYILTSDGRSGQIINGVVTFSGQPKHLPQTPDGWQEINIAFERPIDSHGLDSSFTLPNGFVLDGAHILRDRLYRDGVENQLFLLIQRRELDIDDNNFKYVYRFFYKGELDLSKAEDEQDMISVPVMPGRLQKLIKAKEGTVFEHAMNDPDVVFLRHDGIRLTCNAKYALADGIEIDTLTFGDGYLFLPFIQIGAEGQGFNISLASQSVGESSGTFDDLKQSPNYFLVASQTNPAPIDVHIIGKIRLTCTERDASSVNFFLRFIRSNQDSGDQSDYDILAGTLIEGETQEIDVDIVIPLSPGERLYFMHFTAITGTNVAYEFVEDSNLSVTFDFRANETYIPCYRLIDMYKHIIKSITGDANHAISELCESFADDILISCADAVRGIEGAMLKTSLIEFRKFVDAVLMAGWRATSETVELENRTNYYQDADEVELGSVIHGTLKFIPAIDLMCNTFKLGSTKQDIEDVNGRYDPNGITVYTGPLTKPEPKEYTQVGPYKTGPVELEMMRINFNGKITTDDSRDSDVCAFAANKMPALTKEVVFASEGNLIFMNGREGFAKGQKISITGAALNTAASYDIIDVQPFFGGAFILFVAQTLVDEGPVEVTIDWIQGGYYSLNRPDYSTIEGVPDTFDDTIYNLPFFTPKTMLFRHGRWIRSMNYGLDSQKIEFANGKDNKNTSLLTVLDGFTTDEDKGEIISSLGAPLFIPWYAVFKTDVPVNLSELLEENPNRIFSFTDEDSNVWRGWVRIAGIAPNDYSPQEFRLLLSPDNDMTRRIK